MDTILFCETFAIYWRDIYIYVARCAQSHCKKVDVLGDLESSNAAQRAACFRPTCTDRFVHVFSFVVCRFDQRTFISSLRALARKHGPQKCAFLTLDVFIL